MFVGTAYAFQHDVKIISMRLFELEAEDERIDTDNSYGDQKKKLKDGTPQHKSHLLEDYIQERRALVKSIQKVELLIQALGSSYLRDLVREQHGSMMQPAIWRIESKQREEARLNGKRFLALGDNFSLR
jgi:hypothetical protein